MKTDNLGLKELTKEESQQISGGSMAINIQNKAILKSINITYFFCGFTMSIFEALKTIRTISIPKHN